MANKIKLAGTTSNNFQIGLQGVTLFSNRASSPYNLSLPANSGSSGQVIVSDGSGNLNWSNSAINAQTVTENTQPNITSLGTLTSLSVSGNANIGNIGTAGLITATGNIQGGNISGTLVTGTLTTAAQPNITSVGTLTSLAVSGTAIAGNLSSQGTVNVGTVITMTSSGGAIATGTGLLGSGVGGVLRLIASANAAFIQSGIYNTSNSAAPLRFTTIAGGREWMRLDENGNLGINITAPTSTLHSNGTANITGATVFGNTISATGTITSNANITSSNGYFVSANANLGYFLNISGNNVGKLFYNQGAVKVEAIDTTSNVQFAANGTVRFSVFANGLSSVNGVLTVGSTLNVGGQSIISGITTIGDYNQVAGSAVQLGIRFPGSSTRYGVGFYPNVDNTIIATFFNSSNTVLGTISQTSSNVTWNGLVNANGAITATGDITGSNLVSANYAIRSVTNSIAAAGSTQGAATALTKDINIVSSASTGANGVRLPTAVTGMVIYVINNTANTIQVYPATNGIIDSLAANAAFAMVANTRLQFAAATTTQWFSV